MYRVFVSHGAGDRVVADKIVKVAIEAAGAVAFLDAVELAYGDEFRARIFHEIHRADELVAILTSSSIERPWVFVEIGAMLALGKRVVALNYGIAESELDRLGIKTIIGPSLIGPFDDIDVYTEQLRRRIKD